MLSSSAIVLEFPPETCVPPPASCGSCCESDKTLSAGSTDNNPSLAGSARVYLPHPPTLQPCADPVPVQLSGLICNSRISVRVSVYQLFQGLCRSRGLN